MDTKYENTIKAEGFKLVVGVDEAGRGPLAGPVVAAAVALNNNQFTSKIGDSKTISAKQREEAFYEIFEKASVGIGVISESVIDRDNILDATFLAMTNAVEDLIVQFSVNPKGDNVFHRSTSNMALAGVRPSLERAGAELHQDICLLIDGSLFRSELPYTYRTIVQGDQSILSIACASIIAKVTRDRILNIYDQIFPQYGFRQHKGYPTLQHKRAIATHGLSLIHRRTFKHVFNDNSKN